MKNYKQILEAIHRGILLALDDFDDLDLIGQQTLTIKDKNITKDYLTLMNYVVDLGLPSGTLWCKYNLGVELDESFNPVDEVGIGNYYAWGEIDTKPYYDWVGIKAPEQNYKWAEGAFDQLTKYVTNMDYIAYFDEDSEILMSIDNLTQLQLLDDAAYLNMNIGKFKFHIPTKELFKELLYYTNVSWKNIEKDFKVYRCIELTSKKNGNKIVFPACGYYIDDKCKNIGFVGQYWSSNINTHINNMAVALNFEDTRVKTIIELKDVSRYIGLQIRPVINL